MRISDWSSDVCSSDLGRRRRGCPRRNITSAEARSLGKPRLGAPLLARCQHGPLPLRVEKFSKRLAVLAVSHRSEEHTSELQSLMRITYAVLRLKNKNTTRSLSS